MPRTSTAPLARVLSERVVRVSCALLLVCACAVAVGGAASSPASFAVDTPSVGLRQAALFTPTRFTTNSARAQLYISSALQISSVDPTDPSSVWAAELTLDANQTRVAAAGTLAIAPGGDVWVLSAAGDAVTAWVPTASESVSSVTLTLSGASADAQPPLAAGIDALAMRTVAHTDASVRLALYAATTGGGMPELRVFTSVDDEQVQVCGSTPGLDMAAAVADCAVGSSKSLEMWVPNNGRPLSRAGADNSSVYLYLRCERTIFAVSADCGLIWTRTLDAAAGTDTAIQGVSSSTDDLFVLFTPTGATSARVVRLNATSDGSITTEALPDTLIHGDDEVEYTRDIQSLTLVPDAVSCKLANATACADKMSVRMYEATPPADGELTLPSFACLEAWSQDGDDTPTKQWSTVTSFTPTGGLHSKPLPFGDVIFWVVRSEASGEPDVYLSPVLYAINRIDGMLTRHFDIATLGLDSYSDEAVGCDIIDAMPDMTVFLSCPALYRSIIALKWTDARWIEATEADTSTGAAETQTTDDLTGASATIQSNSSSGADAGLSESSTSNNGDSQDGATADSDEGDINGGGEGNEDDEGEGDDAAPGDVIGASGTASSSSSSASPPPSSSSSSGGASSGGLILGSTGDADPDSDGLDEDDSPMEASGLRSIVLAFVVLFGLLLVAIAFLLVIRWWRGTSSSGHRPLGQSSPRLGAGIMLDGTLDPDWDPEASPDDEHVDFAAGSVEDEDSRRWQHDRQMIELEQVLARDAIHDNDEYDDDATAGLRASDREFDERDLERALGTDDDDFEHLSDARDFHAASHSSIHPASIDSGGEDEKRKKKSKKKRKEQEEHDFEDAIAL